jgi:hypothetical protein
MKNTGMERRGGLGWALGGLWVALAAGPLALGQTFVFESGATIPDDNPSGVVDVRQVTSASSLGRLVSVGLTLSGVGAGMYNGDLYVTLARRNGEGAVVGFSVLLNRVGARLEDPLGYADSGIDVVFDDTAVANIHSYRVTLGGSHEVALGGPVTGTWRPDGRVSDPGLVLDTDPEVAGLGALGALTAGDGGWVLFAADLFAGRTARLESWSLTFEPVAIPEPMTGVLWTAGGLLLAGVVRKRWTR